VLCCGQDNYIFGLKKIFFSFLFHLFKFISTIFFIFQN
jgi:hypothetical protein